MHIAAMAQPMHVPPKPQAIGLSSDHAAKLQSMLNELQECRRLLDAAIG